MAKFTVLKYNQLFMGRLGFFHLKFSTEEFQKSVVAYLILVHLILLTISSAVFAINSSDVTKKLDAVILIVAGAQSAGCYLSVALNTKKVNALHLELQGIVDKGNFQRISFKKFRIFKKKSRFCFLVKKLFQVKIHTQFEKKKLSHSFTLIGYEL